MLHHHQELSLENVSWVSPKNPEAMAESVRMIYVSEVKNAKLAARVSKGKRGIRWLQSKS